MDEARGGGLDALRAGLLEPHAAAAADADDGAPAGAPAAGAAATPPADRRSLVLSFVTLVFSIPALIGAGSVSAAARSLGHWISLALTSALLLTVASFLKSAAVARRRWGPFRLLCVAAPLILADILRHVSQDIGLWPGCGESARFSRANSSVPFPPNCAWSSSQYACDVPCCVPVWLPLAGGGGANGSAAVAAEYGWVPRQSAFFPEGGARAAAGGGQFATLRADGSLYLPAGFERDAALEPYRLFTAPLVLAVSGERLAPPPALARHDDDGGGRARGARGARGACAHGVNPLTGFCFLADERLPYAARLDALPLRDPSRPFDPTANPRECGCGACVVTEGARSLSPMGWLVTIACTYAGFAALAGAVLWNADVGAQLRKVGAQWAALRAEARGTPLP